MMTIAENHSLQAHNTFKVDVKSRFWVEISSEQDLIQFLREKNNDLPMLFLGGGSNILFTRDYSGYVVKINLKGINVHEENGEYVLVTAMAGENWHQFVQFCLEKNYGGLENLSLIPGNVGTCPIQNIGAYGVEIKDHFVRCKVLDLQTLHTKDIEADECKFGYRESIFKGEKKNRYVILSVTFRLTRKNHHIRTEYGAIREELQKKGITEPTIQEVSEAVIAIRQSKLPDPRQLGNAGSFFKNPVIENEKYQALKNEYPTLSGYNTSNGVKIPAGWLIEQAGWKGKQIGNVATHHAQALVIINATGNATGEEIYDFSQQIIDSVQAQFHITLEREVNCI